MQKDDTAQNCAEQNLSIKLKLELSKLKLEQIKLELGLEQMKKP